MSYRKTDYDAAYTRRVEKVFCVLLALVILTLGVICAVVVWRLGAL